MPTADGYRSLTRSVAGPEFGPGTLRRPLPLSQSLPPFSITGPARTFTRPTPMCIPFVKGMSSLADCLRHLDAGWTIAASIVFAVRNRFQVRWSDTVPHPAKMIKFHSIRDSIPGQSPRDTMNHRTPIAAVENPVTVPILSTFPQPAIAGRVNIEPETLSTGHRMSLYRALAGTESPVVRGIGGECCTAPSACILRTHREPLPSGVALPAVISGAGAFRASMIPQIEAY